MLVVAQAAVGCASSTADPRLVPFQEREREFGRADYIVLPNDQGGEEWVSPVTVEEEVRGLNRNEPAEFRTNYATQQRQVWLYPRDGEQVRFEPNAEPKRVPIEPHYAQRYKEIQAAMPKMKADAERAAREARRQLNIDREGAR